MANYRFVGDHVDLFSPSIALRRFGQKVELDDALAKHAALGGAQLIPEAEFDAIGFTDAELLKYPSAISHMKAPEDFKRRKKVALIALYDFVKTLKTPPAPVQPAPGAVPAPVVKPAPAPVAPAAPIAPIPVASPSSVENPTAADAASIIASIEAKE
jgi:hypothetical protein